MELKFRPKRPRRPELYVLCDVSTSVTSASVFFLSVLHALHDSFRKMRSFVFVERISEVTDVFERERTSRQSPRPSAATPASPTCRATPTTAACGPSSSRWSPTTCTRADRDRARRRARTNGRDPRADIFARIVERAGRTFWLNPEPRLYWNYGDSVIAAYERHCTAFECWTTNQLEEFVKALTRPREYG